MNDKKSKWIMVDVEADGPCPGLYSMICFGAIVVDRDMNKTFYGRIKPISEGWIPDALEVSGFTREETLKFQDPQKVMLDFEAWMLRLGIEKPRFISDNNGFDWQFINYYFWRFLKRNPFGHSSTNLGSLYKGIVRDNFRTFKRLRDTKHTHNPVDDAKGNVEALIKIIDKYSLKGYL